MAVFQGRTQQAAVDLIVFQLAQDVFGLQLSYHQFKVRMGLSMVFEQLGEYKAAPA